MFKWFFRRRDSMIIEETKKSFAAVRKDMDSVGKWIKYLNQQDKQLFDIIEELKRDLSSLKEEIAAVREGIEITNMASLDKQLFKKKGVYDKQTAVEVVEEPVQTTVQTVNFYEILKNLSANERLLIMTLMNYGEDSKLSYEDLAMLLGKEKSTIRGQINSIKQKSEGLIKEYVEKNGKKRVYIPQEIKEKLSKYAKVRVKKRKKEEIL